MSTTTTVTVELTAEDLRLLENALRSFISDFGHDEADVLRQSQALLAKLEAHKL